MTASANPSGPKFAPWSLGFLEGIIERATREDGQPPFADQSLVELRSGVRQLVVLAAREEPAAAAAVLVGDDSFEAEFVVDPGARHHGLGNRMMIELLREAHGTVRIWAHGDHPDARALAKRYDMEPVRELLQLRAAVPDIRELSTDSTTEGVRIDSFRAGVDDAEWLAVNARAFATHPEQGTLAQADLDARMAEDWFDPGDFLIARDADGAMMGFCWLKIDSTAADEVGEFYAVGVHPKYQGRGLGRSLVKAGLKRLAERGIRTASLYVEADNVAAVALYRSFGFTDHSIDIQYELKRR